MSEQSNNNKFYFDDFVIGNEEPAQSYLLQAEEIIAYAKKWDPQPWHIDEVLAKASMFGGLTACSSHIFAIFCITCQQWQSGKVSQSIAGLGFDQLEVHRPAYAGDTLHCTTVCDSVRLSKSKPDRGIVVSHGKLYNQRNELVFSIKSKYMVARDPLKL